MQVYLLPCYQSENWRTLITETNRILHGCGVFRNVTNCRTCSLFTNAKLIDNAIAIHCNQPVTRVVIISTAQFGYHIDTYYYCKYLKDRCRVTYIGWDLGFSPIDMDGIQVISVSRQGGPVRLIRFLNTFWHQTKNNNDIVFIKYFKFVSWILRLLRPDNPMVLDIRTGSVEKNRLVREFYDAVLKIEALFFDNITVISSGLSKKLGLEKSAKILPLGAETISSTEKVFNDIRLLYVGTLYNRNLENVIYGLQEYLAQTGAIGKIIVTIVGDGSPGQLGQLITETERCGISGIVVFAGRVPHDQLQPLFDTHNIGLSYIPLTPYFDEQPPTKTYEYLMSGMPVIGTRTAANQLIINSENGVLIGDSPHDVCAGIQIMIQKMNQFSSEKIRISVQNYQWHRIVDHLFTYLCGIR